MAAREALAAAGEADGEGWVTVTLPVESLDVAQEQLLALGPDAELLEPPELRARFAEAAARAAALYARDGHDGRDRHDEPDGQDGR